MSLSGALSNALSGLTANSRAATLIASNIANATTESYGRRVLSLSSRSAGTSGGVWINGVNRLMDTAVLGDRRLSQSQAGFAGDMQAFASRIEQVVGESGAAGSLTGRYAAFENSILSAASNPASTQRLQAVSLAAQDFADTLNTLTTQIQRGRKDADRNIASQVQSINDALKRVDSLNEAISGAGLRGNDSSSLQDERQRVIDGIAGMVPLRVVDRENGAVAIYAASGAVLLDATIDSDPVEISFTETNTISADMTLSGGQLAGLALNGVPIKSTNDGPLGGGTLGAQLQIRDVVGVDMQAALDGIARDLIDRFSAGGPDATIAPGDPGLFTDEGAVFDPLLEAGIAGRISLNALVAPGSSDIWRLRDGLGATAQGAVGDASLFHSYSTSLEDLLAPSSAALDTSTRTFGQHVADFHSAISAARVRSDSELTFSNSQHLALQELELSSGVDTDAELQNLMVIEQQYAANARVVTVVDELMQRLLNI